MTTFPPLSLVRSGKFELARRLRRPSRKVLLPSALSLAPLAGLAGVVDQAGLMESRLLSLGYGFCVLLTSAILAFLLWRLETLGGLSRLRHSVFSSPVVETLTSVEDFVDRLEELSHQSINVCLFDLTNISRFLVAAPRFLSLRCAPRRNYRQVSNIAGEKGFQDLVRLIRRGAPAERGTYYCLNEDSCIYAGSSFCLIERDDGFYVFLVHQLSDRGTAEVVLVHDETFGRLMLRQFNRAWRKLDTTRTALFRDGRFDRAEEARMLGKHEEPAVSAELRVA